MSFPFWQNLFRPSCAVQNVIVEYWLLTPLFVGISPYQCRNLVSEMPLRHYQKDEAIFTQGEVGIGTALILKGTVQIRSGGKVLAIMEEGDFFGEVALVIEAPRTASAVAMDDAQIVFFLRPQLESLLSRAPRQGARVMQNLARVMATRLGSTNALLEDLHGI